MVLPKSQPSQSAKHNYTEKIIYSLLTLTMLVLKKIQRDIVYYQHPQKWNQILAFQSHHELNIKHYIYFDRHFKSLSVTDKPFLGPQSVLAFYIITYPYLFETLRCQAILILRTLWIILQTTIPSSVSPQEFIHLSFHLHTDDFQIFTVIPDLSSKLQWGISRNVHLEMGVAQFKVKYQSTP